MVAHEATRGAEVVFPVLALLTLSAREQGLHSDAVSDLHVGARAVWANLRDRAAELVPKPEWPSGTGHGMGSGRPLCSDMGDGSRDSNTTVL
jgi:hypothetical protein